MIRDFSILIALLLLSAFFSSSETALVSLSAAKLRAMVEQKLPGAFWVERVKRFPHKLLITILVGNNLVNILASVYATLVFEKILGSAAIGVITGILTLVILIFGEIVPKAFAQAHARSISRLVAFPLYVVSLLFTPIVWLLDLLVKGLLHFSTKQKKETFVTEEELKAFLTIGAEEGAIEKDEQELIENVLQFSDTRVGEIMVPRVDIQALPITSSIRDAANFIADTHHSRIPVYKGTIDNVVGMITVKDVLLHMTRKELDHTLEKIHLLVPLKVPTSKKINELFDEFQKRRMHLAIILDEHGGTAGLITLEDILEELVGDIVDEFDSDEQPELIKIGTSEVQATGKALIENINEALKIKIPGPWHKTISYYITEKLGRFPSQGEILIGRNYTITVDKMDKHTIEQVSVERHKIKK